MTTDVIPSPKTFAGYRGGRGVEFATNDGIIGWLWPDGYLVWPVAEDGHTKFGQAQVSNVNEALRILRGLLPK